MADLDTKPKKDGLKDSYDDSLGQEDVDKGIEDAESHANSYYNPTGIIKNATPLGKISSFVGNKKTGIVGGLIAALVASIMFAFVGVQQFQLVHFAQIFRDFNFGPFESTMDEGHGRIARRVLRYNRDDRAARKLSATENKIANRTEKFLSQSGVEPVYDQRVGGSGELMGYIDNGKMIDLTNATQAERRRATTDLLSKTRLTKIGIFTVYRPVMKTKAGINFTFFENKRRSARQSIADYRAEMLEKMKSFVKRGSSDTPRVNTQHDDSDTDEAERKRQQTEDAVSEGNSQNQEVIDDYQSRREAGLDPAEAARQTSSFKKRAVGVTGLMLVGCMVKGYAEQGDQIIYDTRSVPLMRLGNMFLVAGSQIQSGDNVDPDEVGVLVNQLNKNRSWTEAAAYERATGQPVTGPDLAEDSYPNPEGFTAMFGGITNMMSGVPGVGGICRVAANSFVAGTLTALEWGGAILSGGTTLIVTAASEVGLQLFDKYYPSMIKTMAGESVVGEEVDVDLANKVDAGLNLAANEYARARAGRELKPEEAAELRDAYNNRVKAEFSTKSFAYRMFNLKDHRTLLSQVLLKSPSNSAQAVAAITNIPKNIFGSLAQIVGIGNYAFAQTGTFDNYGITQYGRSLEEMEKAPDPIDNMEWVNANISDEEKEKFSKCFTVDEPELKKSDYKYCKSTSKKFVNFSWYYFWQGLLNDQACAVQDPECKSLELSGSQLPTSPSDSVTLPSGDTKELAKQVLKHPNITFDGGIGGSIRESFVQAANSGSAGAYSTGGPRVNISSKLMAAILAVAEEGIKIRISSLTTGGHSSTSRHYKGYAVDIGNEEVAKELVPFLYKNREALHINELIFSPMPSGTHTLKNGVRVTYNQKTLNSHRNHIHFSVKD